ncbi:hypothetical protein [Bacillus horti]|uniref:Peptidylprolyl isomerase n=1 Tax=Caldalkalibacillus horti TaxID=77523 RepID=A0ABT9W3Y1_9BACI|nr:hypothetical protein [Bacillus horti]MDQ0167951.1 hypothetical protein [Bacillus horti]
MKKLWLLKVLVFLLLISAACSSGDSNGDEIEDEANEEEGINLDDYITVTDGEFDIPPVVARVNDTEFSDDILKYTIALLASYGVIPSEITVEELRERSLMELDQMISAHLIEEAAAQTTYEPTEDQIEEQMGQLEEQEEYAQYTEEQIRRHALTMLKNEHYITSQIGEITVSEEEVRAEYDAFLDQAEYEVMPFDEVRDELEEILIREKRIEAELELAIPLKEEATIEIYI